MSDRMQGQAGRQESGSSMPATVTPDARGMAVGIFFLVLAVYLLTYNGAFKSNDERALFSGTDSFLKRGQFTTNQIYWDYTHVGVQTTAGDMVPNYEPAQMVLDIPFYVWGRALGAAVQGVMFWGVWVTAAAVAVLYLCMLELGAGRAAALLGALVFGLATQVWPYSRTFFREPLTVLVYLVALYALLRYRPPYPRNWVWPALAGTAFGIAFTTKQISVALAPALLLLVFAYERQRRADVDASRGRLRDLAAALLPLGMILILGRVYHQATLGGVEVFARDITDFTTNPQLSTTEPLRLLRAFLGLTISPYKGLFWYSPVLLLGVVGAWPLWRRRPWEALAFAMVIGAHWLGYSRYLYWSGGVAWGSRYMLPVIPFLVLLALPVFSWLVREGEARVRVVGVWATTGRVAAFALIALSVAVQILGVSVDLRTYELSFLLDQAKVYGGIGEAIDALYLVPRYSPVLGHLNLLLSGTQPLDFAWIQLREQGTWALVPAGLFLSVGTLGLMLAAFVALWRRPQRAARLAAGLGLVSVAVCSLLLLVYRQGDGRFDAYGVDRFLRPLMADINRQADCNRAWFATCQDVLIVPDPVLTDYFLNYFDSPVPWYAIEAQPVDSRLLALLQDRYRTVWLARDRSAAADDAEDRRQVERALAQEAFKLDETQFENWARLLQFATAGRLERSTAPLAVLGDMLLAQADLLVQPPAPVALDRVPPGSAAAVTAAPRDRLEVGLHWQARAAPAANYTVFVQLLDAASQVRAQRDRWPADGLYPTGALQAGQVITDNLALPLDVPAGDYRLIAGLYRNDLPGAPRLQGPGGDYVLLGEISVVNDLYAP